jgi:hypothetical protein
MTRIHARIDDPDIDRPDGTDTRRPDEPLWRPEDDEPITDEPPLMVAVPA